MSPDAYISTRGQTDPMGFCDAVVTGLAPDGGLLLPQHFPDVRDRLDRWTDLSYADLAAEVMRPFIGADLPDAVLTDLTRRSYERFEHPDVAPLVAADDLHILELFHGPTLAFKDFALQFLGNLFEYILAQRGTHLNILGATSGDTGSAAIHGVRGRAAIQIFVMHPHGRVSPIQERQMTTVLDANVHNIAIQGTFDDGQRILKELFGDLPFKRAFHLGAVNSVNWARVLAQVVYYFHACFRLRETTGAERVQVAVPTGNFGNIFAGWVAQRMGAPIERLILATNQNDILARFFCTGRYELGEVYPSLSPSMDIQVASNFERYLFLRLGRDGAATRALMEDFRRTGTLCLEGTDPTVLAGMAGDAEACTTIARCYREHGYLLDPHTAVGVAVAEKLRCPECPTVCLATAHPAKFQDAIRQATGQDLARHPALDALAGLPTRCTVLPADKGAVEAFIREVLS